MSFPNQINSRCNKAIHALSQGNPDALADIYDCMGRQIYFLAFSLLKSHHDAEDVLQQVIYEIARNIHAYRQGSNARAWILTIARNQALKMLRERKGRTGFEEVEYFLCDKGSDPLSRMTVAEAMQELSPKEQQIVLLRLESELPFSEIASLLEIPKTAAQKRYQRALKKLKQYYL